LLRFGGAPKWYQMTQPASSALLLQSINAADVGLVNSHLMHV
jgi:hypothetical protein